MKKTSEKKLSNGIKAIIVLIIVLAFTSAALAYSLASVENNIFNFGHIIIDVGYYDEHGNSIYSKRNSDRPIFEFEKTDDNTIKPGEVLVKNIFVENEGNLPTYYKLYFVINIDEIGLAEKINVKIKKDGEPILLTENAIELKASEFTRENVISLGILEPIGNGKRANLELVIEYPDNLPATQRGKLNFDLIAEGVQVKNNEDAQFDEEMESN